MPLKHNGYMPNNKLYIYLCVIDYHIIQFSFILIIWVSFSNLAYNHDINITMLCNFNFSSIII